MIMHTNSDSSLRERLKAYWQSIGVKIRPGASDAELDAFEAKHQVKLPEDFRSYLRVVDGMEEGDSDKELREFYPLHGLRNLADENWGDPEPFRPNLCFVIIDYMISSHGYVICLNGAPDTPTPILFVGGAVAIVAPSFSAFIEAYLSDPDTIVFPS